MKLNGAEAIVHLLERQGVEVIAGIPGGTNLPLYDALSKSNAIRHILTRHEQGAGFIAQGIARITGRPGVFFTTSGPGATNALTAIADAKLDSIPLVCITGQVPLDMIGTDAFQEVDTYGLTIPITKHNFLVRSAEELLQVIPEAFSIAASGRPGPVLVDVPKDVQLALLEVNNWPAPGGRTTSRAPTLEDEGIIRIAEMLNKAKRPILCLGGGVIQSRATQQAISLLEKASIPTAMTLMGLGAIATDNPLSLGMLGMHGARYTNLALKECDLFIALGARFGDRSTGNLQHFCPQAAIAHIDIDPSELGKIKTPHTGVTGDVREALNLLLPLVKKQERKDWREEVNSLKQLHPLMLPEADKPDSAYGLILHAAMLAGENAIVTTDVGQHQMRTAQAYPFQKPGRWLTSGGLGTMGFGIPAAIGAALAEPDATVLCFTGDGSLMMNIQELATAMEQNVNLKIILMNNNSLGLVRQQQDLFFGKRYFASDYSWQVDFVRIAQGFGMAAYDLDNSNDPENILAQALTRPGPCLIHARVDMDEAVYPMVPPGAANHDMIGGKPHGC
jgi:acetolactate synthase I/II/III large subunit